MIIFLIHDHLHDQSISYKFHPNRVNNYIYACCVILYAFSMKLTYLKISLGNTMPVPSSLDLDQARYFVGPDIVPNCMQM